MSSFTSINHGAMAAPAVRGSVSEREGSAKVFGLLTVILPEEVSQRSPLELVLTKNLGSQCQKMIL